MALARRGAESREARRRPSEEGILSAAERVFATNGYGETSLRQLIAAAGVSTTAFYARFDSKEAVLAALLARFLGELSASAAEELARARSLEEGFDVGIDLLVRLLARHRPLVRLALTEAAASPPARKALRQAHAAMAELVAARLQHLVKRGTIEIADADALAWALVGALEMQVMRWAVFEELSGAELERSLRATARVLLPAIGRRGKR